MISFFNNRNKIRPPQLSLTNQPFLNDQAALSNQLVVNSINEMRFKTRIKHIKSDIENEESIIYKNETFNWVHYLLLYPDLVEDNITNCVNALDHWNKYGKYENRRSLIEQNDFPQHFNYYTHLKNYIPNSFVDAKIEKSLKDAYTLSELECFNKYPNLFHKYLLYLRIPRDPLTYKITKSSNLTRNYVCAIHCYDLNVFCDYFERYLNNINDHFDIIVTYCVGNDDIINFYNYSFINVRNIGMDIGGKFAAVKHLEDNCVNYDYIFFIHSKNDKAKRKSYIEPLTKNLKGIRKIMDADKNVGAFMPPWLYIGSMPLMYGTYNKLHHDINSFSINEKYTKELTEYCNCPFNLFFLEGNVFILNKVVAKDLYSNVELYNILNTFDSFDYNWVNNYYKLEYDNFNFCYKKCRELNLHTNNLITGLGHNGLADGMIEHAFERMLFSTLEKNKMPTIFFDRRKNQRVDAINKYLNGRPLNNLFKEDILNIYETTEKYSLEPCVIACHTNSKRKIYNVVNNIKYFFDYFDNFYIINSSEFENDKTLETLIEKTHPSVLIHNKLSIDKLNYYRKENSDLNALNDYELMYHFFKFGIHEHREGTNYKIVNMLYTKNSDFVCYDKYLYFYKNVTNNFNKIMLTNDSFLITRPLNNLMELSQNNFEMLSLNASNEIRYHYSDFLRIYTKRGFIKMMDHIKLFVDRGLSFYECIVEIEANSIDLFENRGCLFETEMDYNGNIHFDDEKCINYLQNLNYPVVKLKKINSIYYENRDIPVDFDENVYRNVHPDLRDIVDLKGHFITFGMSEGRCYKPNQPFSPPQYLVNYLNEYIDQNRDICFYELL
jgi:hypothetical protein